MYQIFGWLGLILLQSSNIPQLYKSIKTKKTKDISLFSAIIVFFGLSCYLIYSVIQKDLVYIVSNLIGLCFNTTMIVLIWRYGNGNRRNTQ
jgi:MtN3 and saliva related transmembrane protein